MTFRVMLEILLWFAVCGEALECLEVIPHVG
jgi:hypothetical protein